MTIRRISRRSSALDTSFQIPLSVNSATNDLLLEDDALKDDFFDGFDYTLTTPLPTRVRHLRSPSAEIELGGQSVAFARSEQEVYDFNYLQEEQETELEINANDETPRGIRIGGPALIDSASTPRPHRNGLDSKNSNSVSRLPTSASSIPVPTIHQEMVEQNSPAREQPCGFLSPSVTPKPKRSLPDNSRAPPSPAVASAPSPSIRPSEAQLRDEEGVNMSRHEHAPTARGSSALSSVPAPNSEPGQSTSASVGELSRNPRSPEKAFNVVGLATRAKHPAISLRRRQSRSRLESRSPSRLMSIGHDAGMLPIQEEEEDWQQRDGRLSISNQISGFAAPKEGLSNNGEDEGEMSEDQEGGNPAGTCEDQSRPPLSHPSPVHVASPKSKTILSRRPLSKRSGDGLVSLPAMKKRKGDLNVINTDTGVDSVKGSLQPAAVHLDRAGPVYPTSTNGLPTGGAETDVSAGTLPVVPDSNSRSLSPPSGSYPLIDSRSDAPLGGKDVAQAVLGTHEGRDEVQDFLSRYAKKYGAVPNGTSKSSPAIPKTILPVTLGKNENKPRALTPPDCCDVVPEFHIPRVQHAQAKTKQSTVKPGPRRLAQKTGAKQTRNGRNQAPKPHPAPAIGVSEDRISKRTRTEGSVDPGAVLPSSEPVDSDIASRISPHERILQETGDLPGGHNSVVDASSSRALKVHLSGPSAQHHGLVTGTAVQFSDPQASGTIEKALGIPRKHDVPKLDAATSVPEISAVLSGPAAGVRESTGSSMDPHTRRSVDGGPTPGASVPQVIKKKVDPELHADDMFARKKRDNYLQKGIDLSAHSSRRRYVKPRSVTSVQNKPSRVPTKEKLWLKGPIVTDTSANKPTSLNSVEAAVAGPSRSVTSDSELAPDTGNQEAKQRAPPDEEFRDPSEGSVKSGYSKNHGKEAVDTDLKSLDKDNRRTPSRRGKWSNPEAEGEGNVSTSSVAERLVHLGQKIVNSFRLGTSQSDTDPAGHSNHMSVPHVPGLKHGHQVSRNSRGSIRQQDHATGGRKLLSPRTKESNEGGDQDFAPVAIIERAQTISRHQQEGMEANGCSTGRSRAPDNSCAILDNHSEAQADSDVSLPLSRRRKRTVRGDPEDVADKDGDVQMTTPERAQKRIKLTREGAFTGGTGASSKTFGSNKVRGAEAEKGSNTRSGVRGLAVNKANEAETRSATLNAEPSSSSGLRGPKNSCSLTIPVAPVFTTDSLRQERVLTRIEGESHMHEKSRETRAHVPKPDDRTAGKRAKMKALSTQTREPRKPTVPHAFRFETDTRLSNRKQDFRAKLVAWEQRATAGSKQSDRVAPGKNPHVTQQSDLPSMTARRRQLLAPTVPISPHFVVETRLAERHKFDEARRAKEKEAERIMEEQRRAREEEEERERREARKRTVPRANQIPEWYSQAPRRTVPSR